MPHFKNALWTLGVLVLCCSLLPLATVAQETAGDKSTKPHRSDDAQRAKQASTTKKADNKLDVDAFVAKQLPELSKLLKHLKEQRPSQYQRVSRDLERSIQRLENLRDRDEKLYEVDLQLWKTRSQLQIIAAQFSVSPPKDEKDDQVVTIVIRKLLDRKMKLEIKRLQMLRAKAVQQLADYDEQIAARQKEQADEKQQEAKVEQYKRRSRAGK